MLSAAIARLMSKCPWRGWKWQRGIKGSSLPLPLLSCKSWMFIKENSDRYRITPIHPEVATRGLLWKKLFLRISKCLQESPYVGVSFYQSCAPESCNFIKKILQQRSFPVNIKKFSGTLILKNICEQLLLYIIGKNIYKY